MRPRYYLPKQEFRTRGEIMESSAASFVVKIGGRLLRGTLLYLGRGEESLEGGTDRADFLSFRFVKKKGKEKKNFSSSLFYIRRLFSFDWISRKIKCCLFG